jgi:hypothetical protein
MSRTEDRRVAGMERSEIRDSLGHFSPAREAGPPTPDYASLHPGNEPRFLVRWVLP